MFRDEEWLALRIGLHPVYVWGGYGVVMPTRLTSNGNARMVAEHVVHMVGGGSVVTESALPEDTRFDDAAVLAEALRNFRDAKEGRSHEPRPAS